MDFYYEVSGRGEPLILIGGLTANCHEWSRMDDDLTQRYTVYKLDNRGAGQTGGSLLSIEQMAHDIANFIEQLGLGQVRVVGHSMGGAMVQRLCLFYPHLIKAAVIASSFACFPKAAQLYIESSSELLAAGLDMTLVLRTIYTRLYGSEFLSHDANITAELARMLEDPFPQTPEGYASQVQAIARFDSREDLNRIQCPVLIVHGLEDVLTPMYLAHELHQGIAQSSIAFIPHCGHMIPQEKPKELAQWILDFFA